MANPILIFVVLAFVILASFGPGADRRAGEPGGGGPGEPVERILFLYHTADALFHLSNSTAASDSTALADFQRVIGDLGKCPDFPHKDTLLFQSYLKKGILLDSKYDYAGAREAYCKALSFHTQNDSLAFVAHVYAGTSYYNLNNFDSARYFLLRAESLANRWRDQEDDVRLYNTLGVLYYDNGNYRQGKNYFDQALTIVKGRLPFDTVSAVSLQTNIATSFYRLGSYEEALSLYHAILRYRLFTNPIYLNMGKAYAALHRYTEALACFRQVDAKKVPGVMNEMGLTQLQLHRPDSAAWFLDRLSLPVARDATPLNALDLGINDLYRADLLAGRQEYMTSLVRLQQAIIIFSRSFSKEDIFANPSSFTGTFAYFRLFDALFKKAVIFEQWYRAEHKEAYLIASYDAYKAALSILRYIERSYDTDDAKIFLKKKSSAVSQGALSVCLELYRNHSNGPYLEQAFLISEQNKASIITANLQEKVDKLPGAEEALVQKERNIKYNIARLNVKSEAATDRKEIETIAGEKSGYEIELARLQKELEQNSHYYQLKYEDSSPGIKELQTHLDGNQALISCYVTPAALHLFIVTQSSFAYTRVDSLSALQQCVQDWLHLLQTTENGRKFKGAAIGDRLHTLLIKPIQALIPHQDEWIIIPDGFLYFLPFESLPSGEGSGTLLETTTISYQFSTRFVVTPGSPVTEDDAHSWSDVKVLAFAPFAGQGTNGIGGIGASGSGTNGVGANPTGADRPEAAGFSRLAASREEIDGLPGRQYIDSAATKDRFLQEINKYPIVHLATHAVSSADNAAASFIAFYPQKRSAIDNRLFLEELYGLDMKATRLVIMSACETGQGELVSNEGVISLARAFAYAGCASTVSSLWKADDKATSFILRQFYVYLEKGYTKPRALRQAKLDYLESDAINKSPAYWSHLVLMGDTGPMFVKRVPYVWGLLILPLGLLFWMVRKKRGEKKKKSTIL